MVGVLNPPPLTLTLALTLTLTLTLTLALQLSSIRSCLSSRALRFLRTASRSTTSGSTGSHPSGVTLMRKSTLTLTLAFLTCALALTLARTLALRWATEGAIATQFHGDATMVCNPIGTPFTSVEVIYPTNDYASAGR